MSIYNYPQVVPHLVEDINLKRARVETEEGDAIRVTGINCGDKVTITPTLSEGTKIADFTINNVDGELYAPEAEVSITPSLVTGTKIADFSINDVAGVLYAPTAPTPSVTEVSITPVSLPPSAIKIADFSINNVSGELKTPQPYAVTNVSQMSASGGVGSTKICDYNYLGSNTTQSLYIPASIENDLGTALNNASSAQQTAIDAYNKADGITMGGYLTTVTPSYNSGTMLASFADNNYNGYQIYLPDSAISAFLPKKLLNSSLTNIDETDFPLDFTSYLDNARQNDSNMKISLRINGTCYSQSIYNYSGVDSSFECYRSAYDSGTQTTTFSRYRFGWDYKDKTLSLTGSMSWTMSDAGAISNVTHGLTGLVITIYQIETY
jgi:hypothetical protein